MRTVQSKKEYYLKLNISFIQKENSDPNILKTLFQSRVLMLILALSPFINTTASVGDLLNTIHNPTPSYRDNFGNALSFLPNGNMIVGSYSDDTNGTNSGSAYVFETHSGSLLLTLTNPTQDEYDLFGISVAGTPDGQIVVGASGDDTLVDRQGAVHLFDGTSGVKAMTIHNPYAGSVDNFGRSLAITSYGDIIVSAPLDDQGTGASGSVYIFESATGNLKFAIHNPSNDMGADERFGHAVASLPNGDILIGAYQSDTGAVDSGIVYLFDGDSGSLKHTFHHPSPVTNDRFGYALAVTPSGNIIIGALYEDTGATNAGSVYVFDGQTKSLIHTINNPTPSNDDQFGNAVASTLNGDIVIGSYQDDTDTQKSGSVYIFDGQTGSLRNRISNPQLPGADFFGWSIAVTYQGEILVGAPEEDTGSSDAGSVFIFEGDPHPSNLTWIQDQSLYSQDNMHHDYFGWASSHDENFIVVGAVFADPNALSKSGAAYVFKRNDHDPDIWEQAQKIIAPDGMVDDYFGFDVCVSGTTIAIGSIGVDENGNSSGAVYIYELGSAQQNPWTFIRKLGIPTSAAGSKFGFSVDLDQNTLVVGARENSGLGYQSGAAFVYERNYEGSDNWGQIKEITPMEVQAGDWFGEAVGISGNRIIVGSPRDDDGTWNAGAVYVFERNHGGNDHWGQSDKILPADPRPNARFGSALSLAQDRLLIGAKWDNQFGDEVGSAYIFQMNSSQWVQMVKIYSSDGTTGDEFGSSLSLSGDVAVVAAASHDADGDASGAVYVFELNMINSSLWQNTAKLTPLNNMTGNYFGKSVSVTNDLIIVGAYGADDVNADGGGLYLFKKQ